MVEYVDPRTHDFLELRSNGLVNMHTGSLVAPVVDGIPRFVDPADNYAESFGYQWKKWHSIRSDVRNQGYNLQSVILERTHFSEFKLEGKTLLECGMGGGDDTEVLLRLPFYEVHSFDLSTAVERAAQYLKDPRLHISQASIYDIPYPDRSFDVVYCHRVLQHTPDPALALRNICAKVKPGGLLFAHSYKRSRRYMSEWRYKYRWLTKRLPWRAIVLYLDIAGPFLHRLNRFMYRHRLTRSIAYKFIPFYYLSRHAEGGMTAETSVLELEKQITFDALTPWHDHPMRPDEFRSIIESEGFEILYMTEHPISPMYCTAIRRDRSA
ncbi:class I SAM-dependent methyltransferase [Parasulfuritortus cantonensis]|nr:class I SAM-dependent methyltransferase [Parasulfuritortus cantonensis]